MKGRPVAARAPRGTAFEYPDRADQRSGLALNKR